MKNSKFQPSFVRPQDLVDGEHDRQLKPTPREESQKVHSKPSAPWSRSAFRLTQRELVEQNVELERRGEEKTKWLLDASHDLRNRLYGLSCWAEMLSEEPGSSPEAERKGLAAAISVSTEFMLQLVDDLAEIATADSTSFPLALGPTALLDVVQESISLNRPFAERKATTVELVSPPQAPVIRLDLEKMRRVLFNIIHNAVKYSQQKALVQVCVVIQGDVVLVSVRDNGPGIPADELDSIFVPFQKTRARAACSDPGTGLGLAICKRIVERHGGRIWAESTLGRGATFTIALPHDDGRRSNILPRQAMKKPDC